MNRFLRYLADKNSAHRQTDRQTDRHTPMTTRPCGLRRAGNYVLVRKSLATQRNNIVNMDVTCLKRIIIIIIINNVLI